MTNVNDSSNLSDEEIALASPCDEHPSQEDFSECFTREWDEFCDGFAGCVAQATPNAPLIVIVIAIHCAAC